MSKKTLLAAALLATSGLTQASAGELLIESWRNDDLKIWQDVIIPAFEKSHPGITVKFQPMAPREYNSALNAKLDGGTAGDLITCRPYDASLQLFQKGKLLSLSGMEELKSFPEFAVAAWSTDDGKDTFCMPMASVIHGFMYNKDAFKELGLEVPTTEAEFFAVLDKIKEDGTYVPLAMGTTDQWEAATMGYTNIGPVYWKGEEGRKALLGGTAKLTDPAYVEPMQVLQRWKDYMPDGYQAQTYPDSQNMFTLGRAVIYPTGSWEIYPFGKDAAFEMGAFKPPVKNAGDKCYITDHVDIGLGINAATKNKDEAMQFVKWVGSAEFAQLYSNQLPGFFSLSTHPVQLENPVAQEFMSWRKECEATIRLPYHILSRGQPNLWNEMWVLSANVINDKETPENAMAQMQKGLEGWYQPKK
ncbi:MAG TPA: ABC transporter substrate-binding protein [Geminicoccaceae bacterium]|nr:ABC transporter substrate-binding protein [Geminicoccus sp.]HMU53189.1 ABC transporter substrate-binding protein [Geminicoccaceae bacterium]